MPIELVVPKVGESIVEVEIGEWLKAEGDDVAVDETVAMLDSEKTTVELRSPVAGVLGKIIRKQGDTAAIGEVVAYLEEGAAASSNGTQQQSSSTSADESQAQAAETPPPTTGEEKPGEPKPEWDKTSKATPPTADANASQPQPLEKVEVETLKAEKQASPEAAPPLVMPAARRELAEQGLKAEDVASSGPGGRLLKEDVIRHVEQMQQKPQVEAKAPATPQETTAPAQPKPPPQPATSQAPAQAGEDEEIVPMSLLRRKVAERLVEAQQTAALLTTFNEVDMSAVMALRSENQEAFQKRYGIKLGFMSFFVKASIDALKQIPGINAELRGNNIVYKNHYDIGVAIGSGKGLVVPVLRHAERMSFAEIELAIAEYAKRAKESKLVPDDLMGGTFTISNGGVYGSLLSTPIVNPPQSGILGMHAIQERPIAVNGEVVIRPMMYIALTYDHRIVDGREAVTFLIRIKQCIENPARMLLEV